MPTDDLVSLAFESVSGGTFARWDRKSGLMRKRSADHPAEFVVSRRGPWARVAIRIACSTKVTANRRASEVTRHRAETSSKMSEPPQPWQKFVVETEKPTVE